jgi:outer membrane protein assembly factor BamE (lipoprotein component of BamABCDE complex)
MYLRRSPRLDFQIAAAVLALCLVACAGSKINKENFDRINTGMSQAEVQSILGPPTESESVDVTVFSGTSSTWKWQDTTITIQFVNGKVIAKQLTQGGKQSP